MLESDLIDEHVSEKQCELAVDALLKHEQRRQEKLQETQLLPGKEQNVWLVLTVKQMQPQKKLKPHRIPIVHPLVDPRTSGVCLITKDPQRTYKDLLEKQKVKFVSRVVGVEKLKGKWKPFEARRLLLKENELFMADERVIPLLPKLLGKMFFNAKKQPIPVNLTRQDLKGELERAISSTYFHQNQGTCASIKVGTLSQTSAQVLANLKQALPAIVQLIKGNWDNVQSLNIKTNTSASLPIWSCDLGAEDGGRWEGLADVDMDGSDEELAEETDEESEAEQVKPKKSGKGKKRAAEDDEPEQPKKKAKAAKTSEVSAVPAKATKTKPVAADESTSAHEVEKPADAKKKRKAKVAQPAAPLEPSTSTEVPAPSKTPIASVADKKKKRKAQAAAVSEPAPTSSTTSPAPAASTTSPVAPVTPTVNKKRRTRSNAKDFFDETEATPVSQVAPPPNTPADGLTAAAQTPAKPKSKKKGAAAEVAQTPVSLAIEKLTDHAQADPAPSDAHVPAKGDGEPLKPARKPRHKKSKGDEPAPGASASSVQGTEQSTTSSAPDVPATTPSSSAADVADGEKQKKRKRKQQGEAVAPTDAAVGSVKPPKAAEAASKATVTASEIKQKLASSGLEKKKEKAVKAKRSAKDALLGKKA